nr:hypothetical protein [Tanacetum cinerariifolium]
MEEINNFQQEPGENLYQAEERFKELLMKCRQHYLTEIHEVVLFYNGLDVPTRQILDSKGAIPSKATADAEVTIQEMAEYSQNGTMEHLGPETLFEDYIELNDLNVPLELRRDQVDDLMPTIEEGEVVEEFRARNDARMTLFEDYIELNDLNVPLEIRRDQVDDLMPTIEEGEVVEEFRARNDARMSHPRFKRHTNKQCNKILPLLKESEEDKMNGSRTRTKSSRDRSDHYS